MQTAVPICTSSTSPGTGRAKRARPATLAVVIAAMASSTRPPASAHRSQPRRSARVIGRCAPPGPSGPLGERRADELALRLGVRGAVVAMAGRQVLLEAPVLARERVVRAQRVAEGEVPRPERAVERHRMEVEPPGRLVELGEV